MKIQAVRTCRNQINELENKFTNENLKVLFEYLGKSKEGTADLKELN